MPGQEEAEDTPTPSPSPTPSSTLISAPTHDALPIVDTPQQSDHAAVGGSAEGYSVLQKGLFLAVILGCIAVYVRMSKRSDGYQKAMTEKSNV
jgi:hypothetical protein